MEYQGPKIKSGDKKRVRVSRCVVHPSKKKRGMDKNEIGLSIIKAVLLD